MLCALQLQNEGSDTLGNVTRMRHLTHMGFYLANLEGRDLGLLRGTITIDLR